MEEVLPSNKFSSSIRLQTAFLCLFMTIVLAGCAGNKELIRSMSESTGDGIFQPLPDNVSPAPGYADLHISSSIKTHQESAYSFATCNHGKLDFMLVVNVDGQVLQLKGAMKEEREGYVGEYDPEAGNGTRYTFNQAIRLKPGKHLVKIGIADDGVALTKEITLKEGVNYLDLKPVYRETSRKKRIGFRGETTFYQGVKTLNVVVAAPLPSRSN